ncbi:MAG: TonB-dependent receptor [Maricaulaceae bacterium]
MNNLTKKQLLLTTLLSAVTVASFSAPAVAQDADGDEIIVTGSRIKQLDFQSNSPVATVNVEQFEKTFSINTENLLNTLPQTVAGLDRTSNNPGNGSATVNLRGLGANRTLVLVNGTRQIPFGQNGVVDLNTIPVSLIENVEVLTGGASSVYGADAVAGVVNFILDDDFEGFESNVGYSITDEGDAGLFNLSATIGANFDDDRGNVVLDVSYANRDSLFQGDRDFSEVALFNNADNTGLEPGGSSGTLGTTLFGFSAPNLFATVPDNSNGNGLFDGNGGIAPFISTGDVNDFYNYAPVNFLQLPQERFTITSLGSYEINNHVEIYGRGTFAQNRVDSQLAPTPIFQTSEISLDGNPFLSAETQAILSNSIGNGVDTDGDGIDDTATGFFGRRLEEVGPRVTNDINDVFQITLGARGDITDVWGYDVFFQEGRTTRALTQLGNVNRDRYDQALLLADADGDGNVDLDANGNPTCADTGANGGTVGCTPLNIFGAGNISQGAADFINTAVASTSEFQQTIIQGNVFGDLGELSLTDTPIGVAIGGEYIETEADFRPSQDLAAGTIAGFNGSPPSGGSFDVYSIYGELKIPLVEGLPFAQNITLDLAGRYSDYNTTGGNETYKIGGSWAVNDQLRFRGNYNRAVRAPNIGELFAPVAQGFPGAQDPCSSAGAVNGVVPAAVQAVCLATGVSAANIGSTAIDTISGQVETLAGGNVNLDVETADTFTIGAVIEPEFIPGLSLSVDYYDITIDDAIAAFGGGAQNVLDTCLTDTEFGGVGSEFCNVIQRQPGGLIDFISLQAQNVASIENTGIDILARYGFEFSDWGNFNVTYNSTINLDNNFTAFEGADVITCAGEFGTTCGEPDPTYRHRTTGGWDKGPFSAQVVWRLVGSVDDDAPGTNFVDEIGTFHYFDASASWDLTDNYAITVGMNNVFDRNPPVIGDNDEQANTFPATYDVFGRTLFASLRTKF